MASEADPPRAEPALPSSEVTAILPGGEVPPVAALARRLDPSGPVAAVPPPPAPGTAVDAMRDEEIARTRLFIRMGWLLSLVAIATMFVIDAPPALAIIFVAGLVLGMIVSFGYHRAFAEPRNYTERALMTLAVICTVNGHLAVLIYGAYTAAPLMVVIGIHFVARTEAERIARWIFASAVISYTAIAAAIISGAVADPGVFASDRPVDRTALAVGALFVLATFWLAYYTARQFRAASLAAIDDLQRATWLASQRAAMMDELRGDLARALRAGPGRHTDQLVGGFRLGAVLGRGAMGEVYDAVELATGAPAAIKLLRPELADDAAQRARFARELAAGRALDSPHVVRVLGGHAEPPCADPRPIPAGATAAAEPRAAGKVIGSPDAANANAANAIRAAGHVIGSPDAANANAANAIRAAGHVIGSPDAATAKAAETIRAAGELRTAGKVIDTAGTAVPFLAMERLSGHTLAERLRREPRLPGDALRALSRQVGSAIDAAAAAGIVHRDLKPQNLFACDGGTWKVLDFGVAQLAGDPDPARDGSVIGTPHYMAPEQALGRRADTRADLHALGAIVYRCATGRHPFEAGDPAALLYAIVHRMPVRPGAIAALPADFDRFCALALAKAPDQRFGSGAELARALDAALRGELDPDARRRADALIRARPWEAP